jgi:phage baseplate assembly protein gpV
MILTKLGRVRVVLPNYGEVETGWLSVLVPGAGPNKGLIAPPDVNDQVLVLLLNADPDQSILLGGLYGADGSPDAGVEDGKVNRYTLYDAGSHSESGWMIRPEAFRLKTAAGISFI